MSNIDKQALRAQSVEGSYYLAECGYCGQLMPSSKLRVLHSPDGEADCYCPHCNAEDCEISDLGIVGSEVVNAWNYQQKRIEALLDGLEAKEEQRANWFQMAEKLGADLDAAEKRIAELEAREVELPERYDIEMSPITAPHGEWYARDEILSAMVVAGIKVASSSPKGE